MAAAGKGLVLGGGGITGIAWEFGVLSGLAEAGLDLSSADVVVGTSAGSVVGAQILSGVSIEELYADQLRDATGERAMTVGSAPGASRPVRLRRQGSPPARGRAARACQAGARRES